MGMRPAVTADQRCAAVRKKSLSLCKAHDVIALILYCDLQAQI